MRLVHRFRVGAPLDEVWRAFNRPDLTATCLPGASIMDAAEDVITGELKIKVGPLPVAYQGTVTVRDRDEEAHRVIFDVQGADERGQGTIMATIAAALAATDASTDVELVSDLSITGRAARFGAGVIEDVTDRLLEQFESQLSARLVAGDLLPPPEPEPAEAVPISGAPQAAPISGASARPDAGVPPVGDRGQVRPARPAPAPVGPRSHAEIRTARERLQRPRRPYVYQPPSNRAEPHWDTLVRVGRPIVRRVGPPLAVATALGLLIVRLVRPRPVQSPRQTPRQRER